MTFGAARHSNYASMPAADNAERRAGARTLRDLLPSGLYRRLWFRTRSTACKRKTGRGLKLLAKQSFAAERITAGRELHPAPKIAYLSIAYHGYSMPSKCNVRWFP